MIICIIQARTGSTRFPNKVLQKIKYNTVLETVINRVKQSILIDRIIVATTTLEEDNPIEQICLGNVYCYRGNSTNVLDRYYNCAKQYLKDDKDIIVRVTADCPFVFAKAIDIGIIKLQNDDLDYVSNNLEKSFPHGLDYEVFTFGTLKKAYRYAKKPEELEHVTPWIRNNDKMKKYNFKNPYGDEYHIRITIDYPEDLELIQKYVNMFYLYRRYHNFTVRDIIDVHKFKSDVRELERKIMEKYGLKTKGE